MPKSSLKTLIRLNKFLLDEKRKELGQHLRFEAALMKRKELLRAKYVEEESVAETQPLTAVTFGKFVDWYIDEQRKADQALVAVRQQIEKARDEILEAFQTLKTYEITQDNRDKRAKAELERKMGLVLDEIGLTLNRRRKEEEAEAAMREAEKKTTSP